MAFSRARLFPVRPEALGRGAQAWRAGGEAATPHGNRIGVNILVVKPSSLGDILHTFPAVALARQSVPGVHVSWVVSDALVDVVRLYPGVDLVLIFPRDRFRRFWRWPGVWPYYRALRERSYDVVLDFQGLFRSGLVTFLSRGRRRVGFRNAREGAACFYTERVALPPDLRHAVDKNVHLVRTAFGIDAPTPVPDLKVEPTAVRQADQLVREHGLAGGPALLAVAPASRWATKTWPPEFFAGVMDRVVARSPGTVCWLLGTARERPVAEAVAAACRAAVPRNLAGLTDMGTLVELLRRSAALLTNDSGPMHLAACVQVRTVALFGPTDPALTGPYGAGHVVFTGTCPRQPCFLRECPLDRRGCAEAVDPDAVSKAVVEILSTRA